MDVEVGSLAEAQFEIVEVLQGRRPPAISTCNGGGRSDARYVELTFT